MVVELAVELAEFRDRARFSELEKSGDWDRIDDDDEELCEDRIVDFGGWPGKLSSSVNGCRFSNDSISMLIGNAECCCNKWKM